MAKFSLGDRLRKGRPGRRLLALGAVVLVGGLLVAPISIAVVNPPLAAAYEPHITADGFDHCEAPSRHVMTIWWSYSPYYWIGIYMGGIDRACQTQPNLNKTWQVYVTQLHGAGDGWDIAAAWVGYQSLCSTYGNDFSNTTNVAYARGEETATSAYHAAENLGFNTGVIYYDLEAFNGTSTCIRGAKAFITGWDYELTLTTSWSGGVYGSACGSHLETFASITHVPYAIWPADYNHPTTTTVFNVTGCITSGLWTGHQRLKQFYGPHVKTYDGVYVNTGTSNDTTRHIDSDCATGPMQGGSDWSSVGCSSSNT